MATKPSDTFTWATDTNFSSGPDTGNPTKANPPGWPNVAQGNVPGLGVVAAFINKVLNVIGQWVNGWLLLGSSAGGADAHIVETNSSGHTALREIDLVGGVTNGSILWRQNLVDNASPPDIHAGYDTWLLKGTLAANHDVTVFHTTDGSTRPAAQEGQRLRVRMSYQGAFTVTFRNEATNALAVYTSGAGATPGWIEFEYDAGGNGWVVIGWDNGAISNVVQF